MKSQQSPSGQLALLSVVIPGAIGLAVVARTLLVYLGHDPLATLIVVSMGVGLLVGLGELLLRVQRARALEREVHALPQPATEAAVEKASPRLRGLLRARVEMQPTPSAGESITPYLVGLMVMLGLLGTLLGLFETLSGAGRALTESGNVEALRNGLSGPMRGLTRSFGCSAAGVSASAMLGLAAVLVRRLEMRVLGAVHAYSAGPLRELSPVRRQLDALDRLSNQGEALPRAADALALAAERLSGLAERWEAAHQSATEAQQKSLLEAFERLRGELTRAAVDAGKALGSSVTPLVERMVAQTGEAAAQSMNATLSALERDLGMRREADAALRAALREEVTSARTWLEQDAQEKAKANGARLEAMERTLTRHAEEQAARLTADREQAHAHIAALENAARVLTTQLSEDAEARRAESSRLLGDLAARMDQAASDRAQESREQLEAVSALGRTIVEQSSEREEMLVQRWQELTQALAQALSEARADDRTRLAEQRAELERHNGALAERWAALALEVQSMAEASRGEEEARLARLDKLADSVGSDLSRLTGAMSEQLDARLERERLQVERTDAALAAMEKGGRALEEALVRQELAVQTLLEGGAQQLSDMGSVAQQGALEALQKLAGITEQQASRFAEFEAHLAQNQAALTQKLAEELAAQAGKLGEGLAGTTQLVNDAAAVLRASSAEMGAVAELFAKSVERQREAAQSWLESLGELEGAVERAGRGAAADALGDQLASTQEVFARQLQFQRELFEQLRNLRAPAAPARGEHDVSA
jgi:hypothetical protein